jgi:8-amino-7-oxononanoate synthase
VPEVIDTLADTPADTGGPVIPRTGPARAPVAAALAAVDILHNQPELPGSARDRPDLPAAAAAGSGLETDEPAGAVTSAVLGPSETALPAAAGCAGPGMRAGRLRPPPAPAGRSCPRLTARATLSSDDLAVIRHALTAVAEVKVRA